MNKSLLTNIIAIAITITGLVMNGDVREPVLMIGLFTLAGGVTNLLAIHMLFETIPGVYGSGVIVTNFEHFKSSIYTLVMNKFFSREHLDRLLSEIVTGSEKKDPIDFHRIIDQTDLSPTYDGLITTIMESSFGSMLSVFGGQEALITLKEPFIIKMKSSLNDMVHSESFQACVTTKLTETYIGRGYIHNQIEHIVTSRINELTPIMVKDIVQKMILNHLSWLVVWGGVFGGLIGLITSQLPL